MTDGEARARQRFAQAPVARLATVSDEGLPHLVPVVFAVDGDVVYTAVDGKPKSGAPLRRLRNIADNPNVSLLVDHYDDDWNALWWVRVDGSAQIHPDGPVAEHAYGSLRAKYPQYETVPLDGPVIAVTVRQRRWWLGRSSP
ncbi:TIGR03668 family PPOX class F420-dependent oxidoreductase [Williamsia maris]|uniref:PPOX class probable F420-dependent enzyme, Rv0121 family n=1 Tax=Williamsia maris TaxID=72806 RepID=A0ABT1HCC3_9NOCA|nr:TIGR03668 family PPOX class F420-dependent oxidoreductase [Williamsia maris]MCP2174526.1 PPOX class probable F420-dependent enzyme, Rv0121 family [Williamsia maris]